MLNLIKNNLMAKELPYFKFEPNAWENGNIQMLSREDKGLFIDICSMYWSRLSDLPEKLVIQKLCNGNASALISLYEENIIELIDGNIYVKFLSIQLQEFENTSNKNSENAKERWRRHREQKEMSDRNASALIPQSETYAIREEESKEEESKEDVNSAKAEKIDFEKLKDFINQKTGRGFKLVNKKVQGKYLARLKEGYSKQDILDAVSNAVKNDYHKENNFKYLTPEFFSRSETLDKYSNVNNKPKEKNVNKSLIPKGVSFSGPQY